MTETQEFLALDTQEMHLPTAVEKGIQHCRGGDWRVGLEILRKVARKEEKESKLPSLYYSFLGYGAAIVDGARKDGLALCQHAVKVDRYEPENWLNLARVYLLANDRQRGVKALEKGLKLSPRHPALCELRREIGYRRKPVVPFLPRDSFINRYLGERRHQRLQAKGEVD